MNAVEVLRFALRGLSANKMRSALTMLGILIGVAAVILLVAIGEGSSRQIQQNIQRLGANSLTITPSTSGGGGGPGGGFARAFGGGGRGQA
ncbi:ABC transporter permease, partial [Microbispora rosea]